MLILYESRCYARYCKIHKPSLFSTRTNVVLIVLEMLTILYIFQRVLAIEDNHSDYMQNSDVLNHLTRMSPNVFLPR